MQKKKELSFWKKFWKHLKSNNIDTTILPTFHDCKLSGFKFNIKWWFK